jgi:hypothetical protein
MRGAKQVGVGFKGAALVAALGWVLACQSAYYAAMEKIGREKRHILRDRVESGREAQQEAQEQFQTTLERFKAVSGFSGGDLERVYSDLSGEYERSEARAGEVRERIEAIEQVSQDLFDEWKAELEQISNAELKRKSAARLTDTRRQYDRFIAAMRRASEKMDPVLGAFRDQVLFLKHNLNAAAIGSLQGQVGSIERDVDALVADMQRAIAEADRFLSTMQSSEGAAKGPARAQSSSSQGIALAESMPAGRSSF